MKLNEEIIEILDHTAEKLAEAVASLSFDVWSRKDFRLFVNFPNISQTEQDRIFNELEVSILGLLILKFDDGISRKDKEFGLMLEYFENKLIDGFLNLFRNLKVEEKFVKQWKTLIDMRLSEYRNHYKVAIRESSKMREFDKNEESLKISWARVETITIDCLTHIRRGNVEEKDPLWKFLRKWFISLESKLAPLTSAINEDR